MAKRCCISSQTLSISRCFYISQLFIVCEKSDAHPPAVKRAGSYSKWIEILQLWEIVVLEGFCCVFSKRFVTVAEYLVGRPRLGLFIMLLLV